MDKMKWASHVDWNRYDADLAGELGITRERVRQVRKQLGLPSSRFIKKPKRFKVDLQNVNWDLSNAQLAISNDICKSSVANQRLFFAPHTKKERNKIKPFMQYVDWNMKQKEINDDLFKRFNIQTSLQNLSRYKKILAPHLIIKRKRKKILSS